MIKYIKVEPSGIDVLSNEDIKEASLKFKNESTISSTLPVGEDDKKITLDKKI